MTKFTTPLPNNWLAETPQLLAARSLANSRSAERELFLKSTETFIKEKNCRQIAFFKFVYTKHIFMIFGVTLNEEKKLKEERVNCFGTSNIRMCFSFGHRHIQYYLNLPFPPSIRFSLDPLKPTFYSLDFPLCPLAISDRFIYGRSTRE
ncbi:hypothetical protein [Peribacillus simplex]|uniref:hypothetical protein n=1 Tax=Peribacillus simplex TaxID=1478 RepID=UPI003D2DA87A